MATKRILLVTGVLLVALSLSACSKSSSELVVTGSVEGKEVVVSSQINASITQVLINSGDVVKAGTMLVKLDDRSAQLTLKKLEIARKIAELQYKDMRNGASRSLINQQIAARDQIKAQLDGSTKELNYLRDQLSDAKALISTGADAGRTATDLERAIDKEMAHYNTLEEQLKQAQSALDLTLEGTVDEKLQQALLNIQLKDKEIQEAKLALEKYQMTAPLNGRIQTVNYEAGEQAMAGQKLFSIVNDDKLELKVYVAEKSLNQIALGQQVSIQTDFKVTKPIVGKITYIASEAEFTPKNVESKESKQEMVFEVRIKIEDPNHVVKPGMYLDANLSGDH